VFQAMTVLFALSLVGFVGARRGMLTDEAITGLTRLIVDILVPAALIIGMVRGLNPRTLADSGVIIGAMLVITFAGLAFGTLATRLWRGRNRREDHAITALSSFQNGLYLPLPLMLALTPARDHAVVTVYVGAAVLVLSSTQWTIGVWLLRSGRQPHDQGIARSVSNVVSPPVMGIMVGAVLSAIPWFRDAAQGIPAPAPVEVFVKAAEFLAGGLPPLAMVMLGMLIGKTSLRANLRVRAIAIPAMMRFVVAPAIMLAGLRLGWIPASSALVAMVLMAQAASPTAVNLSVAARRFGGDWELLSAALLPIYLLSLVALPLWVALGNL
jgi:predicted permease